MSLPAVVPVAILVLAWDEAAPAVRALLEATEAAAPVLDSVVVLVPAATGEPTQEEFLPLAPEPEQGLPTATASELVAKSAAPLPSAPAVATTATLTKPETVALGASPAAEIATPPPTPAAPILSIASSVTEGATRVLHLSSFSLPELAALSSQVLPQPIWVGNSLLPAAPYLGSQLEPTLAVAGSLVEAIHELPAAGLSPSPSTSSDSSLATAPLLNQPGLGTAAVYLPGDLLPALDAEADLAPVLPDGLGEEIAPVGPAQAGWTEALASLRDPLPVEDATVPADLEDEATYYAATAGQPAAATELPEPLLVSQPFAAPDLNFQVIQYARFAVPVALAQAPFAAIYAPAWPTWLAAQELRYRTRQPLVLHVATLAASDQESVATATGWQAELQRQALQRADLILTETSTLAHRLRGDLGLSPDLVRAVPAADAHAIALALRTARLRPSTNPS